MKPEIIVLWHEPSNLMATVEIDRHSSLALLSVIDDEYEGMNPFYAYPISYLISYYKWVKIGEL